MKTNSLLFNLREEPFQNELAKFIYYRTYSRWLDEAQRRETWAETVTRYCEYLFSLAPGVFSPDEQAETLLAVYDHKVAGSNRLLWAAGETVKQNAMTAYNCSAIALDSLHTFGEILFVLMSGTGIGVSVEQDFVRFLPCIQPCKIGITVQWKVEDSREGWADALVFGLQCWHEGVDAVFNYSGIRPAGSRLSVMGGRASGPEPLKKLLEFTRKVVLRGTLGYQLSPLECADIVNMIGEAVVAGGVRRSSEIILFDTADVRGAKRGAFWDHSPWRAMANNSQVFNSKPDKEEFYDFWQELSSGGTGEPGIFNRSRWAKRPLTGQRYDSLLTNPCGEISLRSRQTCNLSTVILRNHDDFDAIERKVRIATRIGTLQSLISHFHYVRPEWLKNQLEERLLGVSMTGISDIRRLGNGDLECFRFIAESENLRLAKRLGINPSAAITCVKPEGTTSLYTNTSAGMHPRWSPYYLRRVRIAASDPLLPMLQDQGFRATPENGQSKSNATTWVLTFPVAAPVDSTVRRHLSALGQLKEVIRWKTHYTHHNPSCTIQVRDNEWARGLRGHLQRREL